MSVLTISGIRFIENIFLKIYYLIPESAKVSRNPTYGLFRSVK